MLHSNAQVVQAALLAQSVVALVFFTFKTGPPRRHRIQPVEGPVLDPRAKETYLKKGSESGPA